MLSSRSNPHTLIIVCGHAIYRAKRPYAPNPALASNWKLQPFQAADPSRQKQGEHLTFIAHIWAAIQVWSQIACTPEWTGMMDKLVSGVERLAFRWQQLLYRSARVLGDESNGVASVHQSVAWVFDKCKLAKAPEQVFEKAGRYGDLPVISFSGGFTRGPGYPSEAAGYCRVADIISRRQTNGNERESSAPWIPGSHIIEEESASDSFQNILFSLILFRRRFGYYPKTIIVVTHRFKTDRIRANGAALRWKPENFHVIGIDPPMSEPERREVEEGERQNALKPFALDPLGLTGLLFRKRMGRGWNSIERESLVHSVIEQTERVFNEDTMWARFTFGRLEGDERNVLVRMINPPKDAKEVLKLDHEPAPLDLSDPSIVMPWETNTWELQQPDYASQTTESIQKAYRRP